MDTYYEDEWTSIYCGDCRDVLPGLYLWVKLKTMHDKYAQKLAKQREN